MLTANEIAVLLEPYVVPAEGVTDKPEFFTDWPAVYSQLAVYLQLILKWNARTNLTAVREPEQIVCRHFGESLFAGLYLGRCDTLLDFGSGAGFPGIPMQLMRPDVRVTLAESQGKKAAFLREVVRELGLQAEVWAGRVESMPNERIFDAVAMRAVDRMETAIPEAKRRTGARLMVLGKDSLAEKQDFSAGFGTMDSVPIPLSNDGRLFLMRRDDVPRGTMNMSE